VYFGIVGMIAWISGDFISGPASAWAIQSAHPIRSAGGFGKTGTSPR
jgi:hypothetical protein